MTLYVDVDGTLHDYLDKPRTDVIKAVNRFADDRAEEVVIWSGGGRAYAGMMAERYFPLRRFYAMAKSNPRALEEHDIWVDDEAENIRTDPYFAPKCRVMTPEEFVVMDKWAAGE